MKKFLPELQALLIKKSTVFGVEQRLSNNLEIIFRKFTNYLLILVEVIIVKPSISPENPKQQTIIDKNQPKTVISPQNGRGLKNLRNYPLINTNFPRD